MASDAPDSSDSRVGTVIAERYRITGKIGQGGMGAVYRGVHESLRKPVALKFMMPSASSDGELAQRFEREAVATANLKHPNISETTDYGRLPDGTLYLVMECIDGKNLRELCAGERLPAGRALGILKQIAAALSFAHEHDVVHRDLKPDNVIVFNRGSTTDLVKVIDFGIARMKSAFGGGKTALTQAGAVFGTPDYMAPEQALGQAVDARADEYALGVIAYELFTGQPPYSAENTAALMFMHVGAPIPRVGNLAPDLPAPVSDVVAKMMAKLPDERFVSVDDAIAMLTGACERSAPAVVLPPSTPLLSTQPPTPSATQAPTPPATQAPAPTPASPPVPVTLMSPAAPAPSHAPSKASPLPWAIIAGLAGVVTVLLGIVLFFVVVPRLSGSTSTATPDADAGNLAAADTATTTAPTADTKPTATTVTKPALKPSIVATTKPATTATATATATTTATAAATTAAPNVGPGPTNEPGKSHGHGHH